MNGSNGAVALNNAQVSVVGGNDTVDLSGDPGNEASLYSTARRLGSGERLQWGGGAEQCPSLRGWRQRYRRDLSGDPGDETSLYSTAGAWDLVNGSNGAVALNNAQVSVVGGNDAVRFVRRPWQQGNSLQHGPTAGILVNGSNGAVALNSAQSAVAGSSNTIALAGTSAVSLLGSSDAVWFQQNIGGEDLINGFGSADSMWLSALNFASWSVLQGDMTQSGANTVITLNVSDTVTLTNVTMSNLTSSQFHFV